MRLKKRLFIITFLITNFFFFSPLAFAQEETPLNITMSPVYLDLSVNPGQTLKESIKLRNNTLTPMKLAISIKKIVPDNSGNITIQELTPRDDAGSWFHFTSASISALPQEVTSVPVTIAIPKDAAYGYYLTISFTQHAPKTLANEAVAATAALPVLINVRSPGAKTEARIVTFETKNFINEYLPVDFTTQVENTGNIHIRPTGSIFLRNGSDKDLAILNINKSGGDIIPGQIRTFPAAWDDGFMVNEPVMEDGQVKTDGYGRPITHLVFHWDRITSMRFGEYTASLLLVYDNGSRDVALEANTKFWVIPYTIIAITFVTITGSILLIRFIFKWYVKQAIKKYQKT